MEIVEKTQVTLTHTLCILYVHIRVFMLLAFSSFSMSPRFMEVMVCVMHLNHIFRSRDLVKKNESKISKLPHGETPDDRFWDRGFTSPKVHA